MAFQIRKCEKYTNWEATDAVDLNPVDFTDLPDFPYEGDVESEEEFVQYMHELYQEDWYDICDQLEAADKTALADQISMLFEGDMEIYSSTTDKYATEWFDIGEVDSEYSKYGGFNGRHNTLSE
jgi:hypothetical protein